MKDFIFAVIAIVLVAVITLVVLSAYDPNPILNTINSCVDSAQYVGNCIVK